MMSYGPVPLIMLFRGTCLLKFCLHRSSDFASYTEAARWLMTHIDWLRFKLSFHIAKQKIQMYQLYVSVSLFLLMIFHFIQKLQISIFKVRSHVYFSFSIFQPPIKKQKNKTHHHQQKAFSLQPWYLQKKPACR